MFFDDAPVRRDASTTYHRLLAQAGRQRRLLSVHWEVTHRCNERCQHCYLDVLPPQRQPAGELTTAEGLALLDQMAALGVLYLSLSGGEIFVRRDWRELVAAAHARRFVLRIFTNGLAITPAVAAQLANFSPTPLRSASTALMPLHTTRSRRHPAPLCGHAAPLFCWPNMACAPCSRPR
jgi:hypothetical protein